MADDNQAGRPDQTPPNREQGEEERLSLLQMISSVLAAAFGVQSSKNRERDFSRGRPMHFILLGVVFTALFVVAVITVVNLVLRSV